MVSLLLVVLVIAAAVGIYARSRLVAGRAGKAPGFAHLRRDEAAFVESVAEVLFPAGGRMAVSGRDALLPQSIDRYLTALPRAKRIQIRLLFNVVDRWTLLFPGNEPGGRQRFSSRSAAARVDVLEQLANHPQGLIRLLFTALRSVFVLAYLGHPGNLYGLGLAPFEMRPVVSDCELLFPRVGALPGSIPHGPEDRTDRSRLAPLDPSGPRHRAYARAARAGREQP